MNKITLSILLVATSLFGLNAQTVLKHSTHAMQKGDVLNLNRVAYVAPGEGGTNQLWDFSNVEILSDYEINYNEDMVLRSNRPAGTSFSCTENVTRKPFYQITSTQKLYYGVDGPHAQIRFEEPLVDMVYPFAYGDEITGNMNGTYTTTRDGKIYPIVGKYTTTADGWGTLILPNGKQIDNVLRVKSVKDYSHELYNMLYDITVTRYAFFAPSSRYAVMQIQEVEYKCDCACNSSEKMAYFNPAATNEPMLIYAAEENKAKKQETLSYNVYPNPVKNNFTLSYTIPESSNVNVSLLDISGKEIKVIRNGYQEAGNYSISQNIKDINGGVFLLRIQINDEVYTEKLTKK